MFSMRTKSVCILSLICLTCLAGQASATMLSYSGELTWSNGGIIATADWANSVTKLTWTVTFDDSFSVAPKPFAWHYVYTLIVPKKDISHMIVETSNEEDPFTYANLSSVAGTDKYEIATFSPGGSNPSMPEALYGLKFDDLTGTALTLSFYSDRVPVWGDFYAKDGKSGGQFVLLYNAGFTANDIDPDAAPCNGSVNGHLLVPDTKSSVPEPSLMVLLSVGSLALLRKHRK